MHSYKYNNYWLFCSLINPAAVDTTTSNKLQNMKLINEFKEFALKGNMFDMAIGIIIGAAFNKIVSSLVKDVIMPPIGWMIGKVSFEDLSFALQEDIKNESGEIIQQAVLLQYGAFIQTLVDFVIIAATIFVVIKVLNSMKTKSEDEKDETVPTPKNIQLLAEIRDLLKDRK